MLYKYDKTISQPRPKYDPHYYIFLLYIYGEHTVCNELKVSKYLLLKVMDVDKNTREGPNLNWVCALCLNPLKPEPESENSKYFKVECLPSLKWINKQVLICIHVL